MTPSQSAAKLESESGHCSQQLREIELDAEKKPQIVGRLRVRVDDTVHFVAGPCAPPQIGAETHRHSRARDFEISLERIAPGTLAEELLHVKGAVDFKISKPSGA